MRDYVYIFNRVFPNAENILYCYLYLEFTGELQKQPIFHSCNSSKFAYLICSLGLPILLNILLSSLPKI